MWPFKKKVWEEPKWKTVYGKWETVYICGCCGGGREVSGCCSHCGCTSTPVRKVRRNVYERTLAPVPWGHPGWEDEKWICRSREFGMFLRTVSAFAEKRPIVYEYQDACPKCGTPADKESD